MTAPDSKQVDGLVGALFLAVDRVCASWDNNYPGAVQMIIQRLATTQSERWSRDDYEALRNEVATEFSIKVPADIDAKLIDRGYHVLTSEGTGLRASQREELANDAMVSGADVLGSWQGQAGPLLRRLAHNHCLLFPEAMLLYRHFAPPGAPLSRLKEFTDHVVFCRKVNSFRVDVIRNEGESLGMLRRASNHGLLLHRLPAPAIACFVVESYLQVGGHQLDVGLQADTVAMQLSFLLPRMDLFGRWQQELGGTPLRSEVGRSQVRIDWAGFTWLVGHGMVDPIQVAQVLRAHGFNDHVKEAGDRLRPIVTKNNPTNSDAYLAAFLG